jgi:hypothetical protein
MSLCGLWLRGNRSPLSEKSIWAVIMGLFKRQDIQAVNIKAEQLAGLSQTLFEYHDKLDHFQLKAICSLVYDLAGDIHNWTEKEEEIVMKLEDEQRNG